VDRDGVEVGWVVSDLEHGVVMKERRKETYIRKDLLGIMIDRSNLY
jgi:hypothetical protein